MFYVVVLIEILKSIRQWERFGQADEMWRCYSPRVIVAGPVLPRTSRLHFGCQSIMVKDTQLCRALCLHGSRTQYHVGMIGTEHRKLQSCTPWKLFHHSQGAMKIHLCLQLCGGNISAPLGGTTHWNVINSHTSLHAVIYSNLSWIIFCPYSFNGIIILAGHQAVWNSCAGKRSFFSLIYWMSIKNRSDTVTMGRPHNVRVNHVLSYLV